MSSTTYTGVAPQLQAKPAFTIVKCTRTQQKSFSSRDEVGFTTEVRDVEVEGFMVHAYKGHSVFCTYEDLARMNLLAYVPLLREGQDDAVAVVPVQIIAEASSKKPMNKELTTNG